MPELPVGDVLRAGAGGIGSIRTTVRIAVAVTLSYELAGLIPRNDLLLMAPITTLFVIQGSPFATVGASIQRIIGTAVGVVLATLYVGLVPSNALTFGIAMLVALLLARLLPVGLTGQMQVASGALYVLVLGNPPGASGYWRVADVAVGGLVGIAAAFVLPPRPDLIPAEAAIDELQHAQVEQLRLIARELGSHAHDLPDGARHDFDVTSIALGDLEANARTGIGIAAESLRFRPRADVEQRRLEQLDDKVTWLEGVTAQIRSIGGAADRLYDREGLSPALAPEAARALLMSCADLIESPDAGSTSASPRAAATQDRILAALGTLDAGAVSVVKVLESVSLVGRIEVLVESIVDSAPSTSGRAGSSHRDDAG